MTSAGHLEEVQTVQTLSRLTDKLNLTQTQPEGKIAEGPARRELLKKYLGRSCECQLCHVVPLGARRFFASVATGS